MNVGDITITPLLDGEIRADPSVIYAGMDAAAWEPHRRWLDADGNLALPFSAFLIRTGDRRVLIDTGLGPHAGTVMHGGALLGELARAGLAPEDITDVIYTHLHFDHIGWASRDGAPVFTNATHRCDAADWDYFMANDDHARTMLTPVADRVEMFTGSVTLAPGIDTLPTPGHTPGHTALVVSDGTDRVVLLGDAAHCPMELEDNEWDGIGDVDPVAARAMRERLARDLEASGTLAIMAHSPGLEFGRMLRVNGKPFWVV